MNLLKWYKIRREKRPYEMGHFARASNKWLTWRQEKAKEVKKC